MINRINQAVNQFRRVKPESTFFLTTILIVTTAGFIIALSQTLANMLVALPVVLALYGAILTHWQWGIYGLLFYLPFSGLPTILLYPSKGWTTLLKDFLFVIPAYIGFVVWLMKNYPRKYLSFPGAGITKKLMFLLSALLGLHLFNPNLVNTLVGLIGLKVWLFYWPLYFLGYYFVDSKKQLMSTMRMLLGLSMIPAIVGILQAVLLYSGYSEMAYSLYGSAAASVTQNFATLGLAGVGGERGMARIPSLFTFITQYVMFLLTMLAIAYGLWMGKDKQRASNSKCYFLALIILILAMLVCGSRAVYILLPGYFVVALILDGRLHRIWKPILVMAVVIPVGIRLLAGLLGITVEVFLNYAKSIILAYAGTEETGLIYQFIDALNTTWFGIGTGMATGPTRYAVALAGENGTASYATIEGIEAFYSKTIVEIGLPGLALVTALFTWILISSYKSLRKICDRDLRGVAIALLALLTLVVLYLIKGSFLDYDPLNVYFWFFAGLLMKLPSLDLANGAAARPGGQ
jgi:hypothetical protein